MLPKSIPFGAVFARLHAHVEKHNEAQTYLADKIRLGTLLTLEALTNATIKDLRRVWNSPAMADSDQLPGLKTNRPALAALVKCNEKTIYNHLEHLERCGLVVRAFHGWQNDQTVWINSWILFPDVFTVPAIVDLSTAPHPGFILDRRSNLPLSNTLETSSNYSNSGVDSWKNDPGRLAGNSATNPRVVGSHIRHLTLEKAVEPQKGRSDTVKAEKTLESGGGGAANAKNDTQPRPTDKGGERAGNAPDGVTPNGASGPTVSLTPTQAHQKDLTFKFWETVRPLFWPDETFSHQHIQNILRLLWRDVLFGDGICKNKEDSTKRYLVRLSQLDIADRVRIKEGWHSVMPPLAYFSLTHYQKQLAEGKKGNFHHTTPWQIANMKLQEKTDRNRLVDRAVASVVQQKPPRNYRGNTSQLSLYTYWKNRIGHLADIDAQTRFETAMAGILNTRNKPQPTTF